MARIENDYYPTPTALTMAMLDVLPPNYFEGTILECCAGDGAIARCFDTVIKTDIDPKWECSIMDATRPRDWDLVENFYPIDWVITNPPFNKATKILPLAWKHCAVGMAMLLRITYAEPCKDRRDWLSANSDHLRYFIPVNPRPKFRPDTKGSDSTTVAWLIWDKRWSWQDHGIDPPFKYITDWR